MRTGAIVNLIINLTLAIFFTVDALFLWAAWPMPDPRFDWTPYVAALVQRQQCDEAAHLLGDLLLSYDADAVSMSHQFLDDGVCPTSQQAAGDVERLKSNLGMISTQLERPGGAWQAKWRPDWSGVWLARGDYLSAVTMSWRRFQEGSVGLGRLPAEIILGWRCAPFKGPGAAYLLVREDLQRTYPQLSLPSWEARKAMCGAALRSSSS